MESVALFLAGLPLAFAAYGRTIALATFADDEEPDEVEGNPLPWQQGAWPNRVRWAVLALLPPAMAIAGARFDLLEAVLVSLLFAALLACTVTDLLCFRVPNVITYPGTVAALVAAGVMPDGDFVGAVLACGVGAAFFLVLAVLTRGGIGLGDVKLIAMIGAALALPMAYQAIVIGVFAAAGVMLVLLLTRVVGRKQPIPYAPFFALSAIAVVLLRGASFATL
jgi:prepilin signal peptidase PulO-like enzyme (type II secretory pathway)